MSARKTAAATRESTARKPAEPVKYFVEIHAPGVAKIHLSINVEILEVEHKDKLAEIQASRGVIDGLLGVGKVFAQNVTAESKSATSTSRRDPYALCFQHGLIFDPYAMAAEMVDRICAVIGRQYVAVELPGYLTAMGRRVA